MGTEHFDAIIVGSGFGGSVMAYRLAEAGKRVCVLERGKAYPPGSFPRSPYEMKRNFWDPSRGLHGMFNVWSFKNLGAVVSAGLGGGSLIYANVFIRKDSDWFVQEDLANGGYELWPVTREDLEPHYDQVERIIAPQAYPFDTAPYSSTPKTLALKAAAAALAKDRPKEVSWQLPKLAVTFANPGSVAVPGEPIKEEFPNLHGRTRTTCHLCAECDIGCNYGSKNTLDYNYLTLAKRKGAEIRTRTEVRSFRPRDTGRGYEVGFVRHSDETSDTSALPVERATCDRLILSAGALGSTFLLLKNRENFPKLSPRLGYAFSGNGDTLGIAFEARGPNDAPRVMNPSLGPVITSTIRVADELDGVGAKGRGFYLQDAGFPYLFEWLAETADVPGAFGRDIRFAAAWLHARFSKDPPTDLSSQFSALLGDGHLTRSTLPLLGMGREIPDGRLRLSDNNYLDLDWSLDRSMSFYDRVRETMRGVSDALGATYRDDPVWYLSRSLTVHPLGGCPMGRVPEEGVVDSFGQVFNYPGLYVADGSVLPGAVGPNPSFTIAACANRFADSILG
jgi:cholesterol oxidase